MGEDLKYQISKLETALVLARKSREWNRARVVELEDELDRLADNATPIVIDLPPVSDRLYTVDEVIAAQASEGELIARSRDAEIRELEERVKSLRSGNEELTASLDRKAEQIKAMGDRHQRVLQHRNGELEKQRQIIEQALAVLGTEDVVQAQRMCMGALEQRMAVAIREARQILLGKA